MTARNRSRRAAALALGFALPLTAQEPTGTPPVAPPAAGQADRAKEESSSWILHSLSDSFAVPVGGTLRVEHLLGDVRVEAEETDRVHVTAIAQHHRDDPRAPAIRVTEKDSDRILTVEFAATEGGSDPSWARRRIDVGLLVPRGLDLEIRTDRGRIEVKKSESRSRLTSDRGDIVYEGSGSVTAHSERGSLRALLSRTGEGRKAELSSLTGDLWCTLLEGAHAEVTLETRGTVTTDYSVEIARQAGSPLKKGRIRLGEEGTRIRLQSHSGGIRVQSVIVPEGREKD
ncbi:MAG: hypothetical protein AB7G12_07015 [Thermoanaerobaculia bacterium]